MVWFQAIAPILAIVISTIIAGGFFFFIFITVTSIKNVPLGVWLFLGVLLLGALFFGYQSISSGISAFRERATGNERVMLGRDGIMYKDANGETTMRLKDIVALESVWTPPYERNEDLHPGYWTFTIKDCDGRKLEFDSAGEQYLFDPCPIFRDLTARLPETVPVDPNIIAYVQAGKSPEFVVKPQAPVANPPSNSCYTSGDEITYTPNMAMVTVQDMVLKLALIVAVVFSIGSLVCVLPQVLPNLSKAGASLPGWVLPVIALVVIFGAGLSFLPVLFTFLKRPTGNERVILSREAITYRDAKGDTTLRLTDIVAMDGKWTRPRSHRSSTSGYLSHSPGYWTFIVKDSYGQKIELQVFAREKSLFDAYSILRELLVRLPGPIPVNPYLAEYVQTGQIRDPNRKP
ncbi:MAG TPA: hypothetical protein PKH77_23765 [Anaerolineae bacterium]|nr:hypothetical protein [Anaerolineae bacterium]